MARKIKNMSEGMHEIQRAANQRMRHFAPGLADTLCGARFRKTADPSEVTCKNCLREMQRMGPHSMGCCCDGCNRRRVANPVILMTAQEVALDRALHAPIGWNGREDAHGHSI